MPRVLEATIFAGPHAWRGCGAVFIPSLPVTMVTDIRPIAIPGSRNSMQPNRAGLALRAQKLEFSVLYDFIVAWAIDLILRHRSSLCRLLV